MALGTGVAGSAAAAALAWALVKGVHPGPPSSPTDPRTPPAQTIVCAGADRVLRAVDSGECPAGQKRVDLAMAAGNADILQAPDDQPPTKSDELGALERRLNEIKFAPLFTVVDTHDSVILEVRPQGLVLYDDLYLPGTRKALAGIRTTTSGAFFRAASSDGRWMATMEVSDAFAGVRLADRTVPRLELGRKASPGYSFTVPSLNAASNPVAGLGESRAGTGALVVGDAAGHLRATITASDGGEVKVFSEGGDALVSLREGQNGAGLLAIGNAKGTPMVKLGVNDNRYGAVLTGPRAGFPYVPRSGLPGSYFLGCAEGDACAP